MNKITKSKWYTELTSWVFRIFIILTFFFPMYYSDHKKHMYYIGFLWPYAFLLIGLLLVSLRYGKDKWENKRFSVFLLGMIIVYFGLSLFMGGTLHGWIWEGLHNTIAFLFLFVLLAYPKWMRELSFDIRRFLLGCIVVSMIGAVVCYLLGYTSIQMYNNGFVLPTMQESLESYGEKRLSWIYYHKSQFALMQMVFMGYAYRCRMLFQRIWQYLMVQLLFLVCLILAHSWTAVGAVVFLAGGICLDAVISYIKRKQITFKWKYVGILVGILTFGVVVMGILLKKLSQERDLLSMGHRLPIWKNGILYILSHPMGVGTKFGKRLIAVDEVTMVNNCHNVFLNAMYRFSIPVGLLFTFILLSYLVYKIYKQKTWFAVGYGVAVLMLLCIDYSLLSYGVAQFVWLVDMTLSTEALPKGIAEK